MKKPYQIESQRAVKQLERMAADGTPALQTVLPLGDLVEPAFDLRVVHDLHFVLHLAVGVWSKYSSGTDNPVIATMLIQHAEQQLGTVLAYVTGLVRKAPALPFPAARETCPKRRLSSTPRRLASILLPGA